jgi:enoyl-CoA hydratase
VVALSSVLHEIVNGVGHLTLDRPKALNALDVDMIDGLRALLDQFAADPAIEAVLLDSASPKAFCAGGDIRAVRTAVIDGSATLAREFFAHEYALNARIASYPKPFVSLVDGIDMGGGLGLSVHGSVCVATERAMFAMPETAIGFFPDVGASYFLPRLPGQIGRYLGLTGARVAGGDAVLCGLATHFVTSLQLADVRAELLDGASVKAVLGHYSTQPPAGDLAAYRDEIDAAFGAPDVMSVIDRLESSGTAWAQETLNALAPLSVRSLLLTWELLARGASDDLASCLRRELGLATYVIGTRDFSEGVRAMLVDKDRAPDWDRASFSAVDAAAILDGIDR